MEELLNKLIEKGWKPFGWKKKIKEVHFLKEAKSIVFFFEALGDNCRTRELVSKESGLWQFVCKNGMIPKDERVSWRKIDEDGNYINHYAKYREKGSDVEYRIIESALCDEDKLEQFLLDNIKIDE